MSLESHINEWINDLLVGTAAYLDGRVVEEYETSVVLDGEDGSLTLEGWISTDQRSPVVVVRWTRGKGNAYYGEPVRVHASWGLDPAARLLADEIEKQQERPVKSAVCQCARCGSER